MRSVCSGGGAMAWASADPAPAKSGRIAAAVKARHFIVRFMLETSEA
jgi:hypothetical protein